MYMVNDNGLYSTDAQMPGDGGKEQKQLQDPVGTPGTQSVVEKGMGQELG